MSNPLPATRTRVFDGQAQNDFALLSGDRNPIHIDPAVTTRTQVGLLMVHGMHTVLWALDVLAQSDPLRQPIAQVKVRFKESVYIGDELVLEIVARRSGVRLKLCVDGLVATTLDVTFGEAKRAVIGQGLANDIPNAAWPLHPLELSPEQMEGISGWLAFAHAPDAAARSFPRLSAVIGARRVAGLACISRLVGMVCPGLHSILAGFTVDAINELDRIDAIRFKVTSVDERFQFVSESVEGGGWSGKIECFARVPSTAQSSMNLIL